MRLLLLLLSFLTAVPAPARETHPAANILIVQVAALPAEARETLILIKRGGPFPDRKDGSVFGNFERHLPVRTRGHYREYTVPTPGARDRGARRIVAGQGGTGDVRTSGEYYYTADHYRSFRKIRE
ncbi:MAG: ribonuclease [Rhodocyclales bacterium]|nr:ribonuclease [Rhodocyclales bacterium]